MFSKSPTGFFSRVKWQSCLFFGWNVPAQARFKGPLLHRRAKPAHPPHGQGECSICRDDSQRFCRQQNLERINVQSLFEKCLCSEFKEKTNAHCFVWFELSSQAGLAVPEPQKNVRGELVLLQNSSHLHRLVQKKSTPGDQASLETGLDENDASIANIVRLLKFIPGKTFYEIGCKSWSAASKVNTLFRSPSFWLTHKRAGTTV